MAYEYDELNERRRQRSQEKRKRELAKKQAIRRAVVVSLPVLAIVALLILGVLIFRGCQPDPGPTTLPAPSTTLPPVTTAPPTQPIEPETVITLVAGGDLNVTDKVVASGEHDGRYDYTYNFMDIAPIFARAHVSMLNLEGNLFGAPFGSATASAPQELVQALSNAGVDMIQMANSYSVQNGILGLSATLNQIRAADMEPLGAFATNEEFQQSQGFTIRNIGGIRVAFVAFTKGVGSLGLPAGNENCVNLLYKDYTSTYQQIDEEGITAVLRAAQAQKPDITVALLHWGSEYNNIVSESQKKIAELMLREGVDAIIGNHSHYVQQVSYDADSGTVVAYSLGDFYGDGEKSNTNYSILLELEITRNNYTGETKITACNYVPIYTLTPEKDGESMRVVRILEAMEQYERNHVNKVSSTVYENMKVALERIKSRVGLDG